MNERPIILTGESVRSIMEGRKTQTRRVIKPQPDIEFAGVEFRKMVNDNALFSRRNGSFEDVAVRKCPYSAGMKLWVRETWTTHENDKGADCLLYKADVSDPENYAPWRPSIFMPRWACRITLEVANVRVERMQDISEQDAIAEGLFRCVAREGYCWGVEGVAIWAYDPCETYARLWDSINKKRGFGWDVNPFCWAIDFSVVTAETKAVAA